LISLEEQDLVRFKKELWTMGAAEREVKGRCFSSMVIDASFRPKASGVGASGDSRINRFTYRFVKAGAVGASLLNGQLHSGDAITVSVEPALIALARGFILDLTPSEIVLGVDHELCTESISARLAVLQRSHRSSQVIFRIDKDELFSGLGRIRNNLAHLFYAEGDTRRLELVVDLRAPRFDDHFPTQVYASAARYSAHLNVNQQQAMSKVLSAQDYALILGMPGTGKTTVIAAIIKTLVAMGKTVLLTSYTHSAVDTILAKLTDADFGILRLGNIDKVVMPLFRYGIWGH
jgi:DNA replication ATP-dependent helicase Dna2